MAFAKGEYVDELSGPKNKGQPCGNRSATCDQCGTLMCANRINKTSTHVTSVGHVTRWNGFA